MTGIVSTPEGYYLGTITGFIPKPPPKQKGRPKTPEAAMLRYCIFLAEWANPTTNPQLLDKPGARRRAFQTPAGDHRHDAMQRQARRDETNCMGWIEACIHADGRVHTVIVFPEVPSVQGGTDKLIVSGLAWRYADAQLAYGEITLTVQMLGDTTARAQRLCEQPSIIALPGSPDKK